MSRLLFCRFCSFGKAITDGEIPPSCPSCKRDVGWTTTWREPDPKVPYELTTNDRRLLRSLRIASET